MNEMPNFTGVMARPRLIRGCSRFHAASAARRSASPRSPERICHIFEMRLSSMSWP